MGGSSSAAVAEMQKHSLTHLQVWDSNSVVPVAAFELGSQVYCAAMSPLAHAHALIAAGSRDTAVRRAGSLEMIT